MCRSPACAKSLRTVTKGGGIALPSKEKKPAGLVRLIVTLFAKGNGPARIAEIVRETRPAFEHVDATTISRWLKQEDIDPQPQGRHFDPEGREKRGADVGRPSSSSPVTTSVD